MCQGVLAVAAVHREMEIFPEARLIGDARLESVAQILCRADGVVFVVVVTHDIDVG